MWYHSACIPCTEDIHTLHFIHKTGHFDNVLAIEAQNKVLEFIMVVVE